MRLLSIEQDDEHFIIVTDEGRRKITLQWRGLERVKQKCINLLGKNVRLTTWGSWSSDEWFDDIYEDINVRSESKYNLKKDPSILDTQLENIPVGLVFNSQQIKKIYGPPGTGKTTKLIGHVKEAINNGVKPSNIAFISFSNQAAEVAKQQVCDAFPEMGSGPFTNFSTLHSLATKICPTDGFKLCTSEHYKQFDPVINCWDEWTTLGDPTSLQARLKHEILDGYSLSIACQKEMDYSQNRPDINLKKAKNALKEYFSKDYDLKDFSYEQTGDYWTDHFEGLCKKYINEFIRFKSKNFLLSFDDIITKVAKDEFPISEIPTFELLIIDEAQDLSTHLWLFAKKLIYNSKMTYIAGDDDQAILTGIGANPEEFNNIETTKEDEPLKQSFRIPKSVRNYIDAGVMGFIENLPKRKSKEWFPEDRLGEVTCYYETQTKENGNVRIVQENIDEVNLLKEVHLNWMQYSNKNQNGYIKSELTSNGKDHSISWLIMSPTRATGKKLSEALQELGIPHFYRNKPILDPNLKTNKIRVQTIHISKGAEAENTAIVVGSYGDFFMLVNDPRLAYVALTRARTRMFPRVVHQSLLGSKPSTASAKYDLMFPKK